MSRDREAIDRLGRLPRPGQIFVVRPNPHASAWRRRHSLNEPSRQMWLRYERCGYPTKPFGPPFGPLVVAGCCLYVLSNRNGSKLYYCHPSEVVDP